MPFNFNKSARQRLLLLLVTIAALHLLTAVLIWPIFKQAGLLASLAALAYGLGLRHAVDPDHIAAIDNVTRKLTFEKQQPVAVGFFFSAGHSLVVAVMSLVTVLFAGYLKIHLAFWQHTGALIGLSVSAVFLILIGGVNLIFLKQLFGVRKRFRSGGSPAESQPPAEINPLAGGLLNKFLRPALRLVKHSWQMVYIGFLFGLGFDTASEIALLGLSAIAATGDLPLWQIMILPLAFATGMILIDSLDGVLMLNLYGWKKLPFRQKLTYNFFVTLFSVIVAIALGFTEALKVVANFFHFSGGFWNWVAGLSLDKLGYVIIASFLMMWLIAWLINDHIRKASEAGFPKEQE